MDIKKLYNNKLEKEEPRDIYITYDDPDDEEEDYQSPASLDIPTANEVNRATMILNGIYGCVNEVGYLGSETGEKLWLSLTPYEISPSLYIQSMYVPITEDIDALFKVGAESYVYVGSDKYEDLPKKRKEIIRANLRKAMTIGNILNSAKIVTNYMYEVLNPRLDLRFTGKDFRVGQISRFLDSETGEERDRSAFLHIVPSLDYSNQRLAIPFAIQKRVEVVDEKKRPPRKVDVYYIDKKYQAAFVPVNFNFVHSRYTLTIKEFILSSVNEQNREIYSLEKTFDGNTLRFFGSHPKVISLSGILTNFDDDIIGLEKLLSDVIGENKLNEVKFSGRPNYLKNKEKSVAEKTVYVSSRGSMRDVFLTYYNNFLKGTKAKDLGLKIYLYYNWRVIEGFLVDLNISSYGENDNVVMFSANMVVCSEMLVYEQGVGLGKTVPYNYYSRIIGSVSRFEDIEPFKLDQLFSEESMFYRGAYRDFAITKALETHHYALFYTPPRRDYYPSDIYLYLLNDDDPRYIKPKKESKVLISERAKILVANSSLFDKLISYYLYKILVIAYKFNKVIKKITKDGKEISVLDCDNVKALYLTNLKNNPNFPRPNELEMDKWLTDETEKTKTTFFNYWEVCNNSTLDKFLESFMVKKEDQGIVVSNDENYPVILKLVYKEEDRTGVKGMLDVFKTSVINEYKQQIFNIPPGFKYQDCTLSTLFADFIEEIKTAIDNNK